MTKALLMSCNEGVAGESEHTRSCDEVRWHHVSGVGGGLLSTFGRRSFPMSPCYSGQ